jgi:hypothetical protein
METTTSTPNPNPSSNYTTHPNQTSELIRIQKNFIDELESLRREEQKLTEKFNLVFPENVFVGSWDEGFSFENNLKIFLDELEKNEQTLFQNSANFNQNEVNQTLSQLRILREKGQTAKNRAKEEIKAKGLG